MAGLTRPGYDAGMVTPDPDQLGFSLPDSRPTWPPASRFPHNFGGRTVGPIVTEDLLASSEPLLITGYAGVEQLLSFFLLCDKAPSGAVRPSRIRLLIGVEPASARARPSAAVVRNLEDEIADYWLRRGISLLNARDLLATLELLHAEVLQVRSSAASRVHAKVYVGEEAITLGSSNFTRPGLETNLEANARFERADEETRYEEARDLAENLWSLGSDYTEGFTALLEQLLRKVTWQEALARACAELLEGDWAPRHLIDGPERDLLWPSQEQGIAQALWVLEHSGAVLIADATGSGKTRMGAHLLRVLQDRNWRMGQTRTRFPVVVCPPAVRQLWSEELAHAAESVKVYSHGVLSQRLSVRRTEVEQALERTQLLTVDEAHNFLNRISERSRMVYGNVADNVILLSATPINRGARDLLAIVELLGADNFEEDVLDVVSRLAKQRRRGGEPMRPAERGRLRTALQEFVVRRTKMEFNRLIERDPELYVNALGTQCRYPQHDAVVFTRNDPPDDRHRAAGIREKAKNLRGMLNFQKELRTPSFLRIEGWSDAQFLEMRIRGSSALAGYQIRSRLRSSRVALVEHILGTREAATRFGLSRHKKSASGDVLHRLEKIAGRPPKSALDTKLPPWLVDSDAHRKAVEEEMETYRGILSLAEQMSDHRMDANADYLSHLLDEHSRVLAFDSHLISLYDLRRRLEERGARRVALATGEGGMKARRAFSRRFALDATEENVIGLCSDALAEGLNLQGASAVVHLDLPSVIRVLEQRIGRVDRMDSPHGRITVHWPDEPREFQLRADERLFWRLREVSDLLGSNVPIPEGFRRYQAEEGRYIPLREVIEAVEKDEVSDTDITLADAFYRVRSLVSGPEALVPAPLYENLRRSKAKVLSSVAVVPSHQAPWVFLAIGGADRSIPQWVLVEQDAARRVESTLDRVADEVRARLAAGPRDMPLDENAAALLQAAVATAEKHHLTLLSRRKRRALEELEHLAKRYEREAAKEGDEARLRTVRYILGLLDSSDQDHALDLGRLADWWLQLIRREWYAHLTRKNVPRPARLRQLRKPLLESPVATERLDSVWKLDLTTEPLDRRVVAAIVGVER